MPSSGVRSPWSVSLFKKLFKYLYFKEFSYISNISGFCPPVKQCAETPYIEQILERRKNYDSMQNLYFSEITSKISNQLEFTYTLNEKKCIWKSHKLGTPFIIIPCNLH